MKKFIAFVTGSGTSKISTLQEARTWASNALNNHARNSGEVYIAEVIEVVEREVPPIKTRPFLPESSQTSSFDDIEEAA